MSQTKAQLLNPLGDFELTGQLVGVGATFSGNVSIAGTLTKQDVTNVDAVGLITARSGINVTGGNVFIGQGGSGANNAELKLQAGAGTGNDIIAFLNQAGTTKGNLTYDTDNNFLLFNVNASERLRIASDGKIGINKSSPAESLDVTGSIQLSSSLKIDTHPLVSYASFTNISGGTYAARLGSTGSSTIRSTQIYGGGYPIATFDGVNTRLGIGSLAPTEKLDIVQNAADNVITQFRNLNQNSGNLIKFTQLTNGSVTNPIFYVGQGGDNTGDAWLNNAANTSLKFSTNNTERLRITSDGKFVIGDTNSTAQLGVVRDSYSLAEFTNTNADATGAELSLRKDSASPADNDSLGIVNFIGDNDAGQKTTYTYIRSKSTDVTDGTEDGTLEFHTRGNGTITERLRIGSEGQIGIAGANYGTSGQVIISGGSGAAVAWGDAAGGAEFTGISSGSISAGNPVIVHSDGKLSKVGYSWAADLYPNPSGNSNVVQPSSSAMQDYAVAMWARNSDGTFAAGTNPMVSFFYKNSSSQPQYRTSEVTNGTTNMVHKYSSGFNQGDGVGEFDIAWNPDVSNAASGGRMAAVFNRTSGGNSYPNVQILRGPYSNGVWTQGSNTVLDSTAAQGGISIAWHDTNRWVTVYGQSGSYYGHVVTLTGSTSASVGAKSSAIETGLATMSYRGHMSDKDNNGKHIVFYAAKTTGNRNSWRYSVATLSGTTVSFGTPNWIGNDANPGLSIGDFIPATSFDPDQNRFLVVYYKQTSTNGGGAVNKIYGRNAIISGTSVTWSAETEISNTNSPQGYDTAFDTNLKKHFVYIQDGTGANVIYNLVNFTGSAAPSTTSNANVYSGTFEFSNLGIDYDSTYGMIVTGGRDNTDGNHLKEFITRTALSSSNLGDNNFVGFSKGSYTNGQTAKIGSLSALDENQTGLTTSTTYYVKDDGTLSITPSTPIVAAGKAVSSTNLIVKDATPRPGSLGHWTYQLTGGVFKPWCACGYTSNSGGIIGAYECANSSCRYCTGCWQPYCCIQGQEYWNYDLPTEGGGNMCLGCGGCDCNSAYNITRACCCCWPTGRFWFPEVGIYCYNLNMILSACMGAPPSGGCWSSVAYYAVPKCRNRTCCNVFCGISGYQAYSASVCGYCEPRCSFDNVHIDGIVGVADTTKNFMAFGIHKASMTNCVIVQNGLQLRYDGCLGRYPNKVSFQKISNDPRITYCN